MCNQTGRDFGLESLTERDVRSKSIIEVGARDVNGSIRPEIEKLFPLRYLGVDIQTGPGVDEICRAEDLISRFGRDVFDVVICTEVLEHVKNWPQVIQNLKGIMKPGGVLIITTRSKGFDYHGFPYDFWRYEKADMEYIFSDLVLERVQTDPQAPGVFLMARKPEPYVERQLGNYQLYSILQNRKSSVLLNSFYWALVCLPIIKLLGGKEYVSRIMFYNAFPSKIPLLIKNKLAGLIRK